MNQQILHIHGKYAPVSLATLECLERVNATWESLCYFINFLPY